MMFHKIYEWMAQWYILLLHFFSIKVYKCNPLNESKQWKVWDKAKNNVSAEIWKKYLACWLGEGYHSPFMFVRSFHWTNSPNISFRFLHSHVLELRTDIIIISLFTHCDGKSKSWYGNKKTTKIAVNIQDHIHRHTKQSRGHHPHTYTNVSMIQMIIKYIC